MADDLCAGGSGRRAIRAVRDRAHHALSLNCPLARKRGTLVANNNVRPDTSIRPFEKGRWNRSRASRHRLYRRAILTLPSGIAIRRGNRQASVIRARRLQCILLGRQIPISERAELGRRSCGRVGEYVGWQGCFRVAQFFQRLFLEPSRMAGSIVVRTLNPLDIAPDEAAEIAAAISRLNLDGEVRVEEQEREESLGSPGSSFSTITLAFKVGQVAVDEATKKDHGHCRGLGSPALPRPKERFQTASLSRNPCARRSGRAGHEGRRHKERDR